MSMDLTLGLKYGQPASYISYSKSYPAEIWEYLEWKLFHNSLGNLFHYMANKPHKFNIQLPYTRDTI